MAWGCRPCPRPLTQHGTGAAGLGIAGAVSVQAAAKPGCQTLAGTQAALCPPPSSGSSRRAGRVLGKPGWKERCQSWRSSETRTGQSLPACCHQQGCALRPATRACEEAACRGAEQQRRPLPPRGSPPGTGAASPALQPCAHAAPRPWRALPLVEESGPGARGCSQSPPAGNPTRGLPKGPLPPAGGGAHPFSPFQPELWGRRRPCPPSAPRPEVTAPRLGWGAQQA